MIQEGLLCFDDTVGRSTADKVALAAKRYQQKCGHAPNVCYAHPSTPDVGTDAVGVHISPLKSVLPMHFWLGVEADK